MNAEVTDVLARVGLATLSLLTVVTLSTVAFAVFGRSRRQLSSALRHYPGAVEEGRDLSKLADSELFKKAIAGTAKLAERRGLLQAIATRLQQANLPLLPAEALFINVATAALAMFLGLALFGLPGLVIAGVTVGYVPIAIVGYLANRRTKKFVRQLPDALQLLASTLRTGYSLVQGLNAVSKEFGDPLASELLQGLSEVRLGRSVDEALKDVADRMRSRDFAWAVTAIKVQREVGGNLAELLSTVAETIVARQRLRREVNALTAEGRLSAIVLSLLPIGVGTVIAFMNPTYMDPMFDSLLGQALLGGTVSMVLIGYWTMTKMIQIDA